MINVTFKQGYGLNRLICDAFLVIDKLPESTIFLRDVMNVAYLVGSSGKVRRLSHDYTDDIRKWQLKSIANQDLFFSFNHKHDLKGLKYRYVIIYFHQILGVYNGLPVNIRIRNDSSHSYQLWEGIDFHTLSLLRKRFDFRLVTVPSFLVSL